MRILFVTLADSTHALRWIDQLHGLGWDLHLMPVSQHVPPHRALRDVTVHDLFRHDRKRYDESVRQSAWLGFPLRAGRTRAQSMLSTMTGGLLSPPARLARLIRRLKPDVLHTMEMQKAGYLAAECREHYWPANGAPFPRWIYSSWGSDLYYYRRFPEHQQRIRKVLSLCDYYVPDCTRDVGIANELGFRGIVPGVFPGVGGFDLERLRGFRSPGPVSQRRVVTLKGYHDDNGFGRARVAVEALRRCAPLLLERKLEVTLFSATGGSDEAARQMSRDSGVPVHIMPHSHHDEVLRLMGRSRVAIGLSISDGTPNAMLEAMVMGAFPIQSDTESTCEWINSGENGILTPADSVEEVEAALRRALTDDVLVDRADEINAEKVKSIDQSVVRPRVAEMYRTIAGKD